jgi:hypothetical protein
MAVMRSGARGFLVAPDFSVADAALGAVLLRALLPVEVVDGLREMGALLDVFVFGMTPAYRGFVRP